MSNKNKNTKISDVNYLLFKISIILSASKNAKFNISKIIFFWLSLIMAKRVNRSSKK